jgi:hypothetical protein|tara:strand:- start:2462 stop:3037 length:576 start_codon:yes stop_codon:yes gene_type:complete
MNKGIGIIESKEEAVKKSGEQYWKFKIILDGAEKPLTFSLWEYDAGTKVKRGEQVKFYWTEKEGKGFEGQPITYRNIVSIGSIGKYERDSEFSKLSDAELAKQAPANSMKEIDEEKGSGVAPPDTQRMIVRQSALNYATQLEGIFLAWEMKQDTREVDGGELNNEKLYELAKKRIKATAKEFEENVMRTKE